MLLIYVLPPAIVILALIWILPFKKNHKYKPINAELQQVTEQLDIGYTELIYLNNMLDDRKDNPTSLTKQENEVLDIYQQSGIRIPVDIIEELSNMRLDDKEDMFKFIENQRNFWKLENTKKPYRKG